MKRSVAIAMVAALTLPLSAADTALAADLPAAMDGADDVANVVTREVAAFNAHDIATVVKLHAPDAAFTLLPSGKLIAKGTAELTAFFTKFFSDHPQARITLEKQFVLKTWSSITTRPANPARAFSRCTKSRTA